MKADPRPTLIADASHFYELGWMVGTAGNLSARMPDGSFWITASGRSKGQLTLGDFIRIAADGTVLEKPSANSRPSAETSIHQAIYSLFDEAQTCYHVHSIEANIVSRFTDGDELPLPPLEMLKGLGIWEENPKVTMPIFANHLEVPRIASDIGSRFKTTLPSMSALLIRNHGVTVWAASPEGTRNYLEVAEYIFRYMVVARNVGIDRLS
ncbi:MULTISPECIES: methylthioribulose 1-phosphate dehydratase [unclassified Coleofasciculus]|uniref:methylthioribulose 1-phosphate dehydratase n=1 Tax=unclassified Coleofasciculus TaxID=2692782 RepID=UPI00187E6366|nr:MULTISPECIES: methylthioribulose 1-phosphate dehydratase [unclassified Coleofasciculus]MBE9128934.1 methylthioribulose 1-phosphate dehydratase [Coleofasciculus sp. LEGE 07081]MBE9151680.1 methylthioribulose 1-phosphate dehydratase [Coleofasciculus sp. LEGE 07092]